MEIESMYKSLGYAKSELLAEARKFELEGKIEEAMNKYESSISSFEFQLFTGNCKTVNEELSAKIELAKGKIKELNSEDAAENYQNSLKHYESFMERKSGEKFVSSEVDQKMKITYAKEAIKELEKMLNLDSESSEKSMEQRIIENVPTEVLNEIKHSKCGFFDMYLNSYPKDMIYAETENYKVLAIVWDHTEYSDISCKSSCKKSINIRYLRKDDNTWRLFLGKETMPRNSCKDFNYNHLEIEVENDTVRVKAVNDNGHNIVSCSADLDEVLKNALEEKKK